MNRLLRFFRLSGRQQRLAIEILSILWIVRLMLWLLPSRLWRRLLHPYLRVKAMPTPHPSSEALEVASGINRTGRYVSDATCLVRALAGQIMLGRRGFTTELKIGVSINAAKKLDAHAWIVFDNRVIIGLLPSLERYTVMPISDITALHV
jgi:hypothetical protein